MAPYSLITAPLQPSIGLHSPEIVDGSLKTLFERDRRLPAEDLLGQADVGLPLLRIVGRQRLIDELRRDPVSSMTFSASSRMVNSSGLPILIGPVTSGPVSISAIRPSIGRRRSRTTGSGCRRHRW